MERSEKMRVTTGERESVMIAMEGDCALTLIEFTHEFLSIELNIHLWRRAVETARPPA